MRLAGALLALSFAACVLPAGAVPVHPSPTAVRVRIVRAVHRQVMPGVRVTVGPLGALRYMSRCPAPPVITIEGSGARRNALVRCARRHWNVYVPLSLSTRMHVVVAARTLRAGTTVRRRDVRVVTRVAPLGQGGQVFRRPAGVVGQTLTTSLAAGSPLTAGILDAPQTVNSGQNITVRVRSGAVAVELTGVALQPGRPGQLILVENPETGKRFQARVTRRGVVLNLGS